MPAAIDPRKKPASVKVHISTGEGMDIVWSDSHASHYDFAYLREHCPCANCKDERARKAESREAAPPKISGALPMFKPKPKARRAEAVGHYAIQLEFNDGHSAGIFSYDLLRTLCPCAECAREFRTEA
ncbi:MAG TPA: DUF971 domain-containing protein [Candidatus Acidoferrales bacterium]|nr:DUF971 domain-containing protein [Candidatus Acidoferrales bacterium]